MGPHSMLAVRRARVPCAHQEVASSPPHPPDSRTRARALSLYKMVPHALRARRARARAQRVMRVRSCPSAGLLAAGPARGPVSLAPWPRRPSADFQRLLAKESGIGPEYGAAPCAHARTAEGARPRPLPMFHHQHLSYYIYILHIYCIYNMTRSWTPSSPACTTRTRPVVPARRGCRPGPRGRGPTRPGQGAPCRRIGPPAY